MPDIISLTSKDTLTPSRHLLYDKKVAELELKPGFLTRPFGRAALPVADSKGSGRCRGKPNSASAAGV